MKRLVWLFLFLPASVSAVPVVPNFQSGSMTSHTETTTNVTEVINTIDYQTGWEYSVTGTTGISTPESSSDCRAFGDERRG